MRERPRAVLGGALAAVPDALPLLAVLAAALAIIAPAHDAASAIDELLAGLVLVTALDIDPGRLWRVHRRWATVIALAVLPFLGLGLLGFALSRLAHGPTRTGLLALGLSPTEVASVGLIGLAGGPVELALAVLAASLLASALAAPPILALLADTAKSIDVLSLLGRFALVVIAPLIAGILVRTTRPSLLRREQTLTGVGGLLVIALIYVSLSGAGGSGLGTSGAFATAFLAASALAAGAAVAGRRRLHRAFALPIAMRDFAVAAAFAAAAGGEAAARLAGIYGVLMLLAGATVTGVFRVRARR
jgi:BASS family bile acid:Na+ symporter